MSAMRRTQPCKRVFSTSSSHDTAITALAACI
jgi:hypothetical protein